MHHSARNFQNERTTQLHILLLGRSLLYGRPTLTNIKYVPGTLIDIGKLLLLRGFPLHSRPLPQFVQSGTISLTRKWAKFNDFFIGLGLTLISCATALCMQFMCASSVDKLSPQAGLRCFRILKAFEIVLIQPCRSRTECGLFSGLECSFPFLDLMFTFLALVSVLIWGGLLWPIIHIGNVWKATGHNRCGIWLYLL
jgi:hypothetical protein